MSELSPQPVLIATKMLAPCMPADIVARPRLIACLDAVVRHRLTLVLAGAGYGKTTLLSEWLRHLALGDAYKQSVGWLSLDSADNDPVRFWNYVLGVLDGLFPGQMDGMHSLVRSVGWNSLESFLDALVNELSTLTGAEPSSDPQRQYILVLDDYHLISNEAIHKSLDYLLDYLPPTIHLVVASRTTPPLSLSLRRARNQVLTVGTQELRFTNGEAAEFLERNTKQTVSADDVESLQALVEGWVAGLKLSALSVGGQASLRELVTRLGNHERSIGEFLATEVLAYLSPVITDFLLQTSILDRLNGSLCDAVTESVGGDTTLDGLARDNMFVSRLDSGWYQYHPLFAELLQAEIERNRRTTVPVLHRRASEWYEVHLMPGEAIRHASVSQDWQRVARIVESCYRGLIMSGRFGFLADQLDRVPGSTFDAFPVLYLVRAWVLVGADRPDDVEPQVRAAEHAAALHAPEKAALLNARLEPEAAVLRATAAGQRGDAVEGMRLAHEAFRAAAIDDLFIQSWALNAAGTAAARGRDPVETIQTIMECRASAAQADNTVSEQISMYFLAQQYVYQGRLHKAQDLHDHQLALAAEKNTRDLPYAALPRIGIGDLLREWNRLPEAEHSLLMGIDTISKGRSVEFLADADIALARTRIAQGHLPGGLKILEDTVLLARERRAPRIVAEAEAFLARYQLQAGDRRAALRWAQAHDSQLDRKDTPLRELQQMTLARVHHAYGRTDEALRILDALLREASGTERFEIVIEVLVLRALVLHSLARNEPALVALAQALELAEPENHIRVFADEGGSLADLLIEYLRSAEERSGVLGVPRDYIDVLLSAIPPNDSRTEWSQSRPATAQFLLTEREADVCRLLAVGYSDRDVALALFISENTAHTHRRKIYAKLGVHNRRELIQRVKSLGVG